MLLENKVAIVSGIGPGMGRDISLAFAREGADIVLVARTQAKLDAVAAEVEALGRRAVTAVADISDESACADAVAASVGELGRLDIVVNNAFDGGDAKTFMEADMDRWRKAMDVNLFGSLSMTRACVPHLEASGDGRVIMVNSMSVQRIQPRWGSYVASKGALASMTKLLAVELGPLGIRVNAIHPGYIYGESLEWYFNHLADKRDITFQEVYDEIAAETCLKYLPHSEEIAGTAVYFASALAKPVTGQMIGVNAGHWFNG